MSTPAQPESHIQRSVFILPGSSTFVNATGVPASWGSARAGNVVPPSSSNGPHTLGAPGLAAKNLLSFGYFAVVYRRIRAYVLG
jgi:hypothetical protein